MFLGQFSEKLQDLRLRGLGSELSGTKSWGINCGFCDDVPKLAKVEVRIG